MTKKTWLIFGAICIALLDGLIYASRGNRIDVSNVDTKVAQSASEQSGNIGDHTYGNTSSKVVLIEYGDYQCPGCASSYLAIKQVVDKYKDKMGFIFRSYPLYTSHPNAFAAAAAAEAAGLQGKFWEMHDKLYSDQSAWNQLTGTSRTEYFVSVAKSIGIDGDKLQSELDNPNIKRKIDFDKILGEKDKVTGTPGFYINGRNVSDQYFKDGKIVSKNTQGAAVVWSNAEAFEKLVIIPALKEAGINI